MAHTYDQLKHKTLADLRELAKTVEQHEAVQGYSQMNKDHLLPALCKALGIETHHHHTTVGIEKSSIKAQMRALKAQREAALAAHDGDALRNVRRQMHHLNHQIRAHMS